MRSRYGTGSIRQTGPERWQLRWSDGIDPFTGNHIRRSETVYGTRTDANRILAARTSARTGSRITFGALLDACVRDIDVSDATRSTYTIVLQHVPDVARNWTAADVTPPDARRLIEGLTDRHGPQTVRKIHTAIRSCWKEARRNGWVDTDPWHGQRLPRVPASAGKVLTADEVSALVAATDGELEACWLRVHLATGARPGEVVGLRWSAIGDGLMTFTDAKHAGIDRVVAIDATTADVVARWQQRQRMRAMSAGAPLDDDPWLISSDPTSSTPWRREYAGGFRWRRLRQRAGIRDDLRLYDLRHTHNSWLAAAGIDEATRGRRVGNTPAVNLRTYSHATRDAEAADVVAGLLG